MRNILMVFGLAVLLVGCAKPLPQDKLDYVGNWQSNEMRLLILADGSVEYKRLFSGGSKSINAPLQEFIGDDFVVGFAFMTTTFDVTDPPHQENGDWVMTVDGVKLIKVRE